MPRFSALAIGLLASGLLAQVVAAQEIPSGPARLFAPGIVTTIPSNRLEGETFTGPQDFLPVTVQSKLDWAPHYTPKTATLYEKARKTVLRREIWGLDFSFKPLRMTHVDVPLPSGKMQRKLIWYLVYEVTNNGQHLAPAAKTDDFGHVTYPTADRVDKELRYFPSIVLAAHDVPENGKTVRREYLDRVIPSALPVIQKREDPGFPLHDSVAITGVNIPLSDARTKRGVWGVAMWEDIDPRADFVSIYVQGLSNAMEYELPAPAAQPTVRYKTLQLNFYRPGDSIDEDDSEIRFGIPIKEDAAQQQQIFNYYGVTERLDFLWLFR